MTQNFPGACPQTALVLMLAHQGQAACGPSPTVPPHLKPGGNPACSKGHALCQDSILYKLELKGPSKYVTS